MKDSHLYRDGPCSPPAYQAIVNFLDLFGAISAPGRHFLQAVYAADEMLSLTLTLSAVDATYSLGTFDQQGGNGVPLSGEFGMLLISAVPEPSTLILIGLGVVCFAGRGVLTAVKRRAKR